ncbi:MAG: hypothetical protein QM751_13290 [Paludibacteraceae bacterium]
MKKNFTILLFLVLTASVAAQSRGIAIISYSAGTNNTLFRNAATFPATDGMTGLGAMSFGLEYVYPMNNWLSAEAGLNYSYELFKKKVADSQSESGYATSNVNVNLITIPVGFRINFLKYGFIQTGAMLDLLYEPGIGSYFGCGVQYQTEYGLGFVLSPYVKFHSFLPLNFNMDANRILDRGVKIGISYSIDYFLEHNNKK